MFGNRNAIPIYTDREQAGEQLAYALAAYADRDDVLILALPRGGVPVAFEVAQALDVSLDVFLVRKLGVPGNSELAMGAIASGEIVVMNEEIVEMFGTSNESVHTVVARERQELTRRELLYRKGLPPLQAKGKTVVLVDDGIATGATMLAAVRAVRQLQPAQLIVAVPTASIDSCEAIQREVDEVVCLDKPEPYYAVGCWYLAFPQVEDEEVCSLLWRHAEELKHRGDKTLTE